MVIFYSSAHAAYMDCLTKARNRELSWNAAWGQDRRDNNAIYKITSISERNDIFSASRSVTLQLKSSNSSVFMKQRQLVVDAEDRARAVCDRLIKPTRLLVFPKGPDKEPENNSSQIEPVESEDLPFIMHTTDGWVRANPPSGAQLDVCRVLQRRFSCLQKDKRKYRENLKTLEEELKYQVSFD
jgi:hypothetical protein